MTAHIARCEPARSPRKERPSTNRLKTATGGSRRTIASYSTYAEAERAVDWLADHGFAVERSAIVGMGLRSVEQVTGRMTPGRAAKIGAAQGALIGALFALLFGIFFTGPEFVELLLYSLALGALFGALYGASPSTQPAAGSATSYRPRASRRTGTTSRSTRKPPTRRCGSSAG
jgi:hypothetical protein